jgi:hypothetical protein
MPRWRRRLVHSADVHPVERRPASTRPNDGAATLRGRPGRSSRRPLLLVAHLAAAVGLLGVDLALVALGIAGARGAAPESVYPAARLLGSWLAVPLALTAFGSGLVLALRSGWVVTRYWWVTIKLVVTSVLVPVLVGVLVPALARAADVAIGPAPSLLTGEQRLRLAIAPSIAAALLVGNVALSVYKPRWRKGVSHVPHES